MTHDEATGQVVMDPSDSLPTDSSCSVTLAAQLVCESGDQVTWSFTTSSTPIQTAGGSTDSLEVAEAPEGLAALAGDSGVTLSWRGVSDAIAYNLYWSASSAQALSTSTAAVSKSDGTRIKGIVSPYLHTGCAVGRSCCYVATAVNTVGEGSESDEVCVSRSATSGTSGTDSTTTADGIAPTAITCGLEAATEAILPTTGGSRGTLVAALTYGGTTDWNRFLGGRAGVLVKEILDYAGKNTVESQIRVALEERVEKISRGVLSLDPFSRCTSFSGDIDPVELGDTFDVPFYGTLSNGSSEDRRYRCHYDRHETPTLALAGNTIELYGVDDTGVFRHIHVNNTIRVNTDQTATKGTRSSTPQVWILSYGEALDGDSRVGLLDLQHAFLSLGDGADGDFATTADNPVWKTRIRVTGFVFFDDDCQARDAATDFQMTRYEKGPPNNSTLLTRTTGRGRYGSGEVSIFRIASNEITGDGTTQGDFCIQIPQDLAQDPTLADSSNCTALEETLPWAGLTLPFSLDPVIGDSFDPKPFFEEADLISDTGAEISIPNYDGQNP